MTLEITYISTTGTGTRAQLRPAIHWIPYTDLSANNFGDAKWWIREHGFSHVVNARNVFVPPAAIIELCEVTEAGL